MFVLHAPSRADAVVVEFGRLVGRVPALHDLLETIRQLPGEKILKQFGVTGAADGQF